ncbi:uncharacterized protein [Watersipora subatra]|uniref:uncharacterized protein isoform X2 n=1 Tax=Watersipora subatra TaxID=2589382 RepID=UPI00355B5D8E
MAAYLGRIVTLSLKNEGGKYCGRLIAHNHVDGKIVLSKVTCITTGKQLPGNQTFFHDEIILDSMVVTDEVNNETAKMDGTSLKEKSKSMVFRGSKCVTKRNMPICPDLQRETFQLATFTEIMQKADNPEEVPEHLVTASVYEALVQLPHKDEWIQKLNKKHRPSRYIVVDKLGECFDEAIYRIKAEEAIGLAFTGMDISRRGKLCWIQVAASDVVYLFDAYTMGHTCIFYGLDSVLTSPSILKVTHDCRYISDLLFHQYNIKMVNIFDTQVAAVIESRTMNGGHYPAYVRSLQSLVEDLLPIEKNEYHVYKIRQAFKDTEEKIWSQRPMHHYLLDSLAKTVSYMLELREILIRRMMNDFYAAIDAYVSIYRDLTDEESRREQPDQHVLPAVFRGFQRRDELRSRRTQSKEGEHMFNSDGLVETVENPSDLYYKRDSIMHSRARNSSQASSSVKSHRQPGASSYVVPVHLQKLLPKPLDSPTIPASSNSESTPLISAPSTSKCATSSRSTFVSTVFNNPAQTDASPVVDSSQHVSAATSSNVTVEETNPSTGLTKDFDKKTNSPVSDQHSCRLNVHQNSDSSRMLGVAGAERTYRVGRGSPISSSPKVPYVQYQRMTQTGIPEDDYDSGVDSGTNPQVYPEHLINTTGCVSGFQNFEKMGHALLSIDTLPEEFDIRAASRQELQLLSKTSSNTNVSSGSKEKASERWNHSLGLNAPNTTLVEQNGADCANDPDIEWDS